MARANLKRKAPSKAPKNRICILTEGEATEVEYLRSICFLLGLPKELVSIEKGRSTQAKSLVEEASQLKKENERRSKRGKDALVDQWWVVVDTECRPLELKGAIRMAKDNGINLAISDPSFEYWIKLHFDYTTNSYGSVDTLIRDIKHNHLLSYNPHNKHPDMDVLLPLLPTAMNNARRLRNIHTNEGFIQPCTDCDLLIDALAAQANTNNLTFEHEVFDPKKLIMHSI